MEECLRDNIIEYLATIGLRAKDNEVNRSMYKTLMRVTIKVVEDSKIDPIDYLYFLDCVAHNILGVGIFNCPEGEYKVNLKSGYRDEVLNELYKVIETKKEKVANGVGTKS